MRLACLLLQDAQARQGFALEQVSRAATQAGEAAMAMPGAHRLQVGSSVDVELTCKAHGRIRQCELARLPNEPHARVESSSHPVLPGSEGMRLSRLEMYCQHPSTASPEYLELSLCWIESDTLPIGCRPSAED